METLTFNLSGKVRTERKGGREFLVAPVTMAVPGILSGNRGPILYPAEALGADPSSWNGLPLLANHSTDEAGNPVRGNTSEVFAEQGLGLLLNTRFGTGLTSEAWFDVEATDRVDKRILFNVRAGKPIEVSTGLIPELLPNSSGVTANGEAYNATVSNNLRPDHLAILVDKIGACSISDGCGVLNAKTLLETLREILGFVKEPQVSNNDGNTKGDEETTMADKKVDKKLVDNLIENCSCWSEEDREVLNGFSEEKLKKLGDVIEQNKQQELVANAALEGFEDQRGDMHAYNADSGKWEHVAKKEEPVKKEEEPVANKKEEPKTADEWLAAAPPEIKSAVANAMDIESREKTAIVERLTVNVADDKKEAVSKRLFTKSLEDLRLDLELLPAPTANEQAASGSVTSLFAGAAGTVANTASDEDEEGPVAETVTLNHAENCSPYLAKRLGAAN